MPSAQPLRLSPPALLGAVVALGVLFAAVPPAAAEETAVTVRVLSRDAKLIGSSMGGARVTIRDADTGALLAEGVTTGSTGDTERIMTAPRQRGAVLSTPGAGAFEAVLDLDRPTLVEIVASGPLAQRQAAVSASTTRWVLPGKHLTAGDGVLLELAGFAVDVLAPPAHAVLADQEVEVRINLVMLWGCPVGPGGLWDSRQYEIVAVLSKDGAEVARLPLDFAGTPNQFRALLPLAGPGVYEVLAYAYHAATGNTGLDRTTFVVRGQ